MQEKPACMLGYPCVFVSGGTCFVWCRRCLLRQQAQSDPCLLFTCAYVCVFGCADVAVSPLRHVKIQTNKPMNLVNVP